MAFAVSAVAARAADPPVTAAAPPAWVSPLPFQRLSKPADLNSGLATCLLLRDLQVNGRTRETFQHEARQVLTRVGAQNSSRLALDFDPSRQSLVLHWLRIWRGTNAFNKLNLETVQVIQPQQDPARSLFTGEQRALLVLDDVQAGDIVDYACTIRGEDSAGGGRMSGAVLLRMYEPVERLATRLIWPRERHLYLKPHGTDAKPAVVQKEDLTVYTWDAREVPGVWREDSLPAGYDPLPWVQWSEYEKWGEVNQWALTLFTNALPLSPDLVRQIKEWGRQPGAEERTLAVLRFLQDEVRNQGIEGGAEGRAAADPSLVFARRFGDCKDKTMLCVAILRALGIEANPVLVATDLGQTIQDWQPAATVFDHAVVRVSVDSRNYWLDPAADFQRGPLAARSWPNYGRGLVVRPKTAGLEVIPECPVEPRTTVLELVFLRVPGQPADLKVVTLADGADAEKMRRRFSTPDRAGIAMEDLNAFAALYPGIMSTAPLEYADDEKANEVVVTEYYQIPTMWSAVAAGPGYVCRFYSYNVDRALGKPPEPLRSMPLGLNYPEHQVFRAEITLPFPLRVDPGPWTVNNPAFHFQKSVALSGGKAVVEFEYESLAEEVPAEAMPGYARQLDQASRWLGYELFY
ncbi:MAG: DUF3857 domain-containing protein [Verrucomicrobiota bacterium]|jgi:transglutaminase-like putative cysteine protease